VVIPDHRTPVVTQMMWYKVGSADETPGKSGLAHFLEHLMFKGTAKHPAGEFSQTVLKIGGNENAFTSTDYTGYFQRVPREQLAMMMEFEADRMTGLILKDENVLPERDVVLEEFNMRVANNPDARLTEQIMAALYLNHPYGPPGDRLAAGDRKARPRGCAGVLQAVLRAEQRDPGDCRRCRRQRNPPDGGKILRRHPRAAGDPGAAPPAAGAGAGRAAHRDAGRPPASNRPACGAITWCPLPRPRPQARARRSTCSRN